MPYEQPGVMLRTVSKANESVEVDHEYEVLDKYNQAYDDIQVPQALSTKQEQRQLSLAGDYELTQCPTYVPDCYSWQPVN